MAILPERLSLEARPFFLRKYATFRVRYYQNAKKMQKNEKKSQKNLEISKICCKFALSFQMSGKQNTKNEHQKQRKNEQDLSDKKLRRDFTDNSNNQSQFQN